MIDMTKRFSPSRVNKVSPVATGRKGIRLKDRERGEEKQKRRANFDYF